MWSFFHYININEIPGDPSRENISSHVKIACYPIRKITFCCGYIMNRASVWPLGDIQGFTHLKTKMEIITLLLHFIAHITSFHWSIHTFEHLQMSTDYVVGRDHFWERYHRSLYHPDSSSHGLPQIQPVQKLTVTFSETWNKWDHRGQQTLSNGSSKSFFRTALLSGFRPRPHKSE